MSATTISFIASWVVFFAIAIVTFFFDEELEKLFKVKNKGLYYSRWRALLLVISSWCGISTILLIIQSIIT